MIERPGDTPETPRERALSEVHPDDARPLPAHLRDAPLPEGWEIPVVEIPGGSWSV